VFEEGSFMNEIVHDKLWGTRCGVPAVVLVIVGLSFLSTSAVCAEDAHSPDTLLQKKLLSAEEATYRAVLPGFFIHGLGHFYAKDQTTGAVLYLTEVVGILFINNALHNGFSENQFAQRGNRYDIPIGLVAFFGSWLYDIATASSAVEKYNRKITLGIAKMKNGGGEICVGLRF
jgi:hypothetical protein